MNKGQKIIDLKGQLDETKQKQEQSYLELK